MPSDERGGKIGAEIMMCANCDRTIRSSWEMHVHEDDDAAECHPEAWARWLETRLREDATGEALMRATPRWVELSPRTWAAIERLIRRTTQKTPQP